MGDEYKQRLLKKYGLNPDATSREWEDEEHEILALLLEEKIGDLANRITHVKRRVEENEQALNRHGKRLMKYDKKFTELKTKEEWEEQEEISWYRSWKAYASMGTIVGVIVAIIQTIYYIATGSI